MLLSHNVVVFWCFFFKRFLLRLRPQFMSFTLISIWRCKHRRETQSIRHLLLWVAFCFFICNEQTQENDCALDREFRNPPLLLLNQLYKSSYEDTYRKDHVQIGERNEIGNYEILARVRVAAMTNFPSLPSRNDLSQKHNKGSQDYLEGVDRSSTEFLFLADVISNSN